MPKLELYFNALFPPVVWATLIYLLSNQSNLPGPPGYWLDWVVKNSAHALVYFILYVLVWRAVALLIPKYHAFTHRWLPLVICFLYAISDEIHQLTTPTRSPSILDIGFDTFGALLALLWLHKLKLPKRLTT